MSGIKGRSGRPGGAPDNLIPYKTDRDEPLLKSLHIRVSESMIGRLKSLPNWQEFVRQTIQESFDEMDAKVKAKVKD